jgi:hypothetical protein
VKSAVDLKHTQNTDTGTNQANFAINGTNAMKVGDAPTAHNQAITTITTTIANKRLIKSNGSNPVDSGVDYDIVKQAIGVFPAAYNFELDTVGTLPTGWSSVWGSVIALNTHGHYHVLHSIVDENSAIQNSAFTATPMTSGTFEWWFRPYQTNKRVLFAFYDAAWTSAMVITIQNDGKIYAKDGASTTELITYTANWIHIKVKFDCATDLYSVWINGTKLATDFDFQNAVASIGQIYFPYSNDPGSNEFDLSALDWSGDANYVEGQNYTLVSKIIQSIGL